MTIRLGEMVAGSFRIYLLGPNETTGLARIYITNLAYIPPALFLPMHVSALGSRYSIIGGIEDLIEYRASPD